jgi:site-specific DNA recombinase
MTPSHAGGRNAKYRYYLSSPLLQGMAERAGSVRRVPAIDIEALVIKSVREHLKPSQAIEDRSLIHTRVARVEVQPEQLVISLTEEPKATVNRNKTRANGTLRVLWQRTSSTRRREILLPKGMPPQHARPIRSETRATLVTAIARGRHWLDELTADPSLTTESIATRENCSIRRVNKTISLAFLAPPLVKAAIDGRLPRGMGIARLTDLPAEWSRQHEMLGLPSN